MLPPAPRGAVLMELLTHSTPLSALLSMLAQPLAQLPFVLATARWTADLYVHTVRMPRHGAGILEGC